MVRVLVLRTAYVLRGVPIGVRIYPAKPNPRFRNVPIAQNLSSALYVLRGVPIGVRIYPAKPNPRFRNVLYPCVAVCVWARTYRRAYPAASKASVYHGVRRGVTSKRRAKSYLASAVPTFWHACCMGVYRRSFNKAKIYLNVIIAFIPTFYSTQICSYNSIIAFSKIAQALVWCGVGDFQYFLQNTVRMFRYGVWLYTRVLYYVFFVRTESSL